MIPRTLAQLDGVRDECRSLVTKDALKSAAVTAVPIPGVDIAADIAIMMSVLEKINRRFGLSADQLEHLDGDEVGQILVISTSLGNQLIGTKITKTVVVSLLKQVGVRVSAKTAAKYVPVIGSVAAAAISFSAMKFLGNHHISNCYEVAARALGYDLGRTITIDPETRKSRLNSVLSLFKPKDK